ncbi:MAG: monovalent cation/H(+) antiporter subunit G [Bacteroidales bacterium]|nr:monovalent cation/H(+) antiporter subunit G [Bacteroidales bacterium]
MNKETLELIGGIIAIIGSLFLLLGSIGLLRMPDSYNRIQAGTKASTLGTMLSVLGAWFFAPAMVGKFVILILFVLITNPVSSHAIARAAYHIKVPLSPRTIVDKLKDKYSADSDRMAYKKKVKSETE